MNRNRNEGKKVNKEIQEADDLNSRVEKYRAPSDRIVIGKDDTVTTKTFEQLPLSSKTLENLSDCGFMNMTPIQANCIPHALKGNDIVGIATTGTGKTLAYLIPLIEFIFRNKWQPTDGLGALVLVPTRELAMQVFTVLAGIGEEHSFNAGLVTSGKNFSQEARAIWGLNVIVATPGRLIQHMDQTPGFNPSTCRFLVLDEVDLMLSIGFMKQIETILEALPPCDGTGPGRRQTMLLSATAPDSNESLRELISVATNPAMTKIFRISEDETERTTEATDKKTKKRPTPGQLTEEYMEVDHHEKYCVLYEFLRSLMREHRRTRVIVFLASARQVRFLQVAFEKLPQSAGIIGPTCSVMSLSGRDTEVHREDVFREFRYISEEGEDDKSPPLQVLLTTELTARGMDYPEVDIIVQVDIPNDVKTYIHKVGRAARMMPNEKDTTKPICRKGRAILFVAPNQKKILKSLEKKGIKLTLTQTPGRDQQSGELTASAEVFKNALASLCAREEFLRVLSTKALKAYCKACSVSKEAKVPVRDMPVKKMAEFYGLSTFVSSPVTATAIKDGEPEGDLFTKVPEIESEKKLTPVSDGDIERMKSRYNKKGLRGYFDPPGQKRGPV